MADVKSVARDRERIDSTVSEAIRAVDVPLVNVFDRPAREVDFRLYRLVVDDITGREER